MIEAEFNSEERMTFRQLIDRRYRKVMVVVLTGGGLFASSIFANKALGMPEWVWVPGIIGFAVSWLTMAISYSIGFKCPKCGGNLNGLLMYGGGLRMSPKIRCCPYCKVDFDEKMENSDNTPDVR